MRKLIFLSAIIFISLFFYTCNDDEFDEALNTEMKQKIKGRWEIVSEIGGYYSDEVLVESYERSEYEHITSTDTIYLTHLNFDKGRYRVYRESTDGFQNNLDLKWEVENNKFRMWDHETYKENNSCEIHELTDAKFHFTWIRIDKNFFRCVQAYDANECKEIITFELKR